MTNTSDAPAPRELSLEQLAALAGEPVVQLEHWRSVGLLDADGAGFSAKDVEWIRMVQLALRRGISLERLARAQKDESSFLRRYLELFFPIFRSVDINVQRIARPEYRR